MSHSQLHRFYASKVAAPPSVENLRTMAALRHYAETHAGDGGPSQASAPLARPSSAPASQSGT